MKNQIIEPACDRRSNTLWEDQRQLVPYHNYFWNSLAFVSNSTNRYNVLQHITARTVTPFPTIQSSKSSLPLNHLRCLQITTKVYYHHPSKIIQFIYSKEKPRKPFTQEGGECMHFLCNYFLFSLSLSLSLIKVQWILTVIPSLFSMLNCANLPSYNRIKPMENNFRLLVTHKEIENSNLYGVIASFKQRIRKRQIINNEFIIKIAVALRKYCENHFHRTKLIKHILYLNTFLCLLFLISFI